MRRSLATVLLLCAASSAQGSPGDQADDSKLTALLRDLKNPKQASRATRSLVRSGAAAMPSLIAAFKQAHKEKAEAQCMTILQVWKRLGPRTESDLKFLEALVQDSSATLGGEIFETLIRVRSFRPKNTPRACCRQLMGLRFRTTRQVADWIRTASWRGTPVGWDAPIEDLHLALEQLRRPRRGDTAQFPLFVATGAVQILSRQEEHNPDTVRQVHDAIAQVYSAHRKELRSAGWHGIWRLDDDEAAQKDKVAVISTELDHVRTFLLVASEMLINYAPRDTRTALAYAVRGRFDPVVSVRLESLVSIAACEESPCCLDACLIDLVLDADPRVSSEAITTLGSLGAPTPEVLKALAAVIKSGSKENRARARVAQKQLKER